MAVDPELTEDPVRKAEIENAELWYRYAPSDSLDNILDVVWFLHSTYFPHDVRVDHSGRFPRMYLNEKAPDKLYWQE
jgi:hypothetical protein